MLPDSISNLSNSSKSAHSPNRRAWRFKVSSYNVLWISHSRGTVRLNNFRTSLNGVQGFRLYVGTTSMPYIQNVCVLEKSNDEILIWTKSEFTIRFDISLYVLNPPPPVPCNVIQFVRMEQRLSQYQWVPVPQSHLSIQSPREMSSKIWKCRLKHYYIIGFSFLGLHRKLQSPPKRLFPDCENFRSGIAWVVLSKTEKPFWRPL